MLQLTRKEEQILLTITHLADNAYLITIREQIAKYTGKTYSVGTIYAPLNRLHLNGYLTAESKKTDDTPGAKPVKYYRLTEMGMQALADLKQQQEMMWTGVVLPNLK